MKFLFVCTQSALDEFRKPEMDSICGLFGIPVEYVLYEEDRPYAILDLPSEQDARRLGSRLVSTKHIWEYWAGAETYAELHETLQTTARDKWHALLADAELSWKFTVATYARTLSLREQVDVINTFKYMAFPGPTNLRDPDFEVGVFEEYRTREGLRDNSRRNTKDMRCVFVGRKICDGARSLIDKYDLKKRSYIGTTSMEAEVSLYMANQALARPGSFVYDPFAGTGSMLLTCAEFGALVFGSDIDGRQMRGKDTSIKDSAQQYAVQSRIVDCFTFDMTQHPFRQGEIFDAIATDPPYGVRAGAKRLGRKATEPRSFQFPEVVPPSVAWEMSDVIQTLTTYALYLLKPGGRLVFFLPTDNATYSDVDIPVVPGLTLISNASQNFGKWARRLITMEKTVDPKANAELLKTLAATDRGIPRQNTVLPPEKLTSKNAGHAHFRAKYMAGFKRDEQPTKEDA